jgi:hypothetical protein
LGSDLDRNTRDSTGGSVKSMGTDYLIMDILYNDSLVESSVGYYNNKGNKNNNNS